MQSAELKKMLRGKANKTGKRSRNWLFQLISLIADNNNISTSVYFFLVIVEGFHFIYMPIQYQGNEPNNDTAFTVFSVITSFVNYFRFVLEAQSDYGVLIVLFVHMGFVALIWLSACIVIYHRKNRTLKQVPIVAYTTAFMSSSLILITTALIIPMLESFIFPMLCYSSTQASVASSMISCGTVSQIVLSVFGGVFAVLTLVLLYFATNILLDDYWLSTLPWAGESRDVQVLHGLAKVILGLYLGTDIDGKYFQAALVVLLILQIAVVWKRLDVTMPYNKAIYLAKLLQEGIVLVVYAATNLEQLYDHKNTLWRVILVIVVGACTGVMVYMKAEGMRAMLLQKNWNQIKSMSEAESYVQTACVRCFKEIDTVEWKLTLHYVLRIHCAECSNELCECKAIKEMKHQTLTHKALARDLHKDANTPWFNFYEKILESQALKWRNSKRIMMQMSYYNCIIQKNFFKSYYWLLKAEEINTPNADQYLIFRMKHILAVCILASESKSAGAQQVASVLHFQKVCNVFQEVLKHATDVVISFWTLLESTRLNVAELYHKGQRITAALKYVTDVFREATELNSEYQYLYIDYGFFVKSILNSEEEGQEWVDKGLDIQRQQRESRVKYHEDISNSSDSAILVVSGNLNTLGIVQLANEHVQRQLGFAVADLVGRNVSRIMPRRIGEVHDTFLLNHFKTGHGMVLGSERMLFIQNKNGLTEPICLLAKTLPGLERGLQYIGFLRQDKLKLRTSFVRLPSQYRNFKQIAYLLAEEDRSIIGLSHHACELFGVSTKYIMRKKGLTSLPYSVSKLAPELGLDENDHKLEAGMELTLNARSILEYLDYDYLRPNEKVEIEERVQESHRVFMMQVRLNYQNLVRLRAYAIVDLGRCEDARLKSRPSLMLMPSHGSEPAQTYKAREHEGLSPRNRESAAGSQGSSNFKGTSSQHSVVDIKKQAGTRDRPPSVKKLMWVIIIFVFIIVVNVTVEYSLFIVYTGKIDQLHKVVLAAFRRVTHFNIVIYKMLAYLNIANGLEPESSILVPNRTIGLIKDTDVLLDTFKLDIYSLEATLLNSDVSSLAKSVLYPSVKLRNIQANFVIYMTQANLNNALLMFIANCEHIMKASLNESKSPYYINHFTQIPGLSAILNQERYAFFTFVNGQEVLHPVLSASSDLIYTKSMDIIDDQRKILIIEHCTTYAITIIFAIILAPIILRIQRNQHNLLTLFVQIPLPFVKELNKKCKDYLHQHLKHVSQRVDEDLMNNLHFGTVRIQPMEEQEKEKKEEERLQEEELRRKLTQDAKAKVEAKKQDSSQFPDTAEAEGDLQESADETRERLVAAALKEKEAEFLKERKKAIKTIPLSLTTVAVVVVGIFTVVLGYFTKTLQLILGSYTDIKANIDGILVLDKRFSFLSSTLLYYRYYLMLLDDNYGDEVLQGPFESYFNFALHNERAVETLKIYPPSPLERLANQLKMYDSSVLCEALNITGINTPLDWCYQNCQGLLREGLSNSISYFMTRTRNRYYDIKTTTSGKKEKKLEEMRNPEFIQSVLMFITAYNPLFDRLADESATIFHEYIRSTQNVLTIDYAIIIFLVFLGLIILLRYFIRKIETEIFMARGIMAILPEAILRENPGVELI